MASIPRDIDKVRANGRRLVLDSSPDEDWIERDGRLAKKLSWRFPPLLRRRELE